jgi:hypothetical protein
MTTLTKLLILAVIPFLAWGATRAIKDIEFNRNCGGYLERAANANTVEIAEKELNTAINYLENKGLKSGYTSIFWTSPDEDIGYWYENLKASLNELREVDANASKLERSNILIKLRETLIDNGSKRSSLTVPPGISIYPNNMLFFWWGLITAFILCFILIKMSLDEL